MKMIIRGMIFPAIVFGVLLAIPSVFFADYVTSFYPGWNTVIWPQYYRITLVVLFNLCYPAFAYYKLRETSGESLKFVVVFQIFFCSLLVFFIYNKSLDFNPDGRTSLAELEAYFSQIKKLWTVLILMQLLFTAYLFWKFRSMRLPKV